MFAENSLGPMMPHVASKSLIVRMTGPEAEQCLMTSMVSVPWKREKPLG